MIQAIGAFRVAGIVDDNPALTGTSVLGVPVLGTREALPALRERGIGLAANGVGGIINIEICVKLFELLEPRTDLPSPCCVTPVPQSNLPPCWKTACRCLPMPISGLRRSCGKSAW